MTDYSEQVARDKQREIDAWMSEVARAARQYMAQGMSAEKAEERAVNDIRRAIRSA